MRQLMTFIVALIGFTGGTLRAQETAASTQPNRPVGTLAGRPINGEQLEQMLAAGSRQPDQKLAKQLYELELTDRLSAVRRARCESDLPGPEARRALRALADQSSFLDPPATEAPVISEPDSEFQRRMIALSVDYISKTIHQLPNLYATKVTSSFQHNLKGKKLLRWVSTESAIVRYRDGQEISGSSEFQAGASGVITAGEFGPILYAVQQDAAQGDLTWSHWEQGVGAPEAVFRYAVVAGKSHYSVNGQFPGYHGEITVDPSNGTILRLVLRADPIVSLPFQRADFVIEYGPVELGGKTYTCPLKGVAFYMEPKLWLLNDIVFEQYHLYRASAQMLTGPSDGP
jgi:hypothetical protein